MSVMLPDLVGPSPPETGRDLMPTPLEQARAYLDTMEADRRAALALSEQKAEEAMLIQARQEGFRAAMEMLVGAVSVGDAASPPEGPGPRELRRRRVRRDIRQLILRELSFSGQTMSATQIAKAIDYLPERTETALKRMEEAGQILRNGQGRWTIGITAATQPDRPAVADGNGKFLATAGAVGNGRR
jgi:hypothetical protein